ncbi:uncharacterized protein BT62DRAFT_991927 [Guyanagaster necrorhizus]|uniref:Uncharacterized protein n=1 Tax=Guyanagaster necrorhizus TaxID=856835 RepID=A0A9P7W0C2_9AGAR|nr:uncharacterized protein BT62DRAFT_991927 [Guyanagaster necrorhizus MCA 3950]KAG7449847.1 hypothetical protein BT62DRAFT_991927 [Guyanagaster necrorhizus MCA 3950]
MSRSLRTRSIRLQQPSDICEDTADLKLDSQSRNNQPLQNIGSNASRPRRRGRAPIGALGEKLKLKAKALSPLPPSSPTRFSSPILEAGPESDSLPTATSDDFHEFTTESTRFGYNGEDLDQAFYLDFSPRCYVAQDVIFEAPPINRGTGSDPFGFFAVEETLKADRREQPLTHPMLDRNEQAPVTTPRQKLYPATVSPAPRTSGALPSTPSSVKPESSGIPKHKSSDDSDAEISQIQEDPVNNDNEGSEVGEGEKVRARRGKQRQTIPRESIDPDKLAKEWKASLPKRRVRRQTQRGQKEDPDKEEGDRKTTRGRRTKSESKTKTRPKKEEHEAVNDDVDEKFVEERKARLEFFKKLEGYEIHKENVYII